jgi:hypothetical protein
MGKLAVAFAGAYLAIGVIILVSQFISTRFFDPVCVGTEQHILLDRYFPPRSQLDELKKTLTGKRDISDASLALRWTLHIAQWLPDLYREVLNGTMSMRAYFFGGYVCHPNMDMPLRRIRPISQFRSPLSGPEAPSLDEVLKITAR